MSEKQQEMWDKLCELDGETVARLLTDYHGTQLLSDGFREHLQEEGYLEEDPARIVKAAGGGVSAPIMVCMSRKEGKAA